MITHLHHLGSLLEEPGELEAEAGQDAAAAPEFYARRQSGS
jgi:hypothetical protein